jgi:hypothetical protein
MIACPLCEHLQPAGDACDVCGRALERPDGFDSASPALDGLEPTAQPGVGPVDVAPLAELEPTLLDGRAAPGPAPEPFPDLEATRAPALEVELEADPVPDLEPTAAAPADPPTPLAASPTCRYCRTPAAPGERRCARCGMRLPVGLGARAAPAGEALEAAAVRRCSCGAPVSGALCPGCGARISDSP